MFKINKKIFLKKIFLNKKLKTWHEKVLNSKIIFNTVNLGEKEDWVVLQVESFLCLQET